MKLRQTRHSSMFLLELMIAILLFCVASAVCIRLFVKSHIISQEAENLNMALNQVSSVAEVFQSGTGIEEFLEKEFPDYEKNETGFLVYYDDDWKACTMENARFQLFIEITENGTDENGCFTMKDRITDEEIYSVSLEKFIWEK